MPARNIITSRYYSGQGVVLIGEKDAVTGNAKGLLPLANVPDLKLSVTEEVEEHKESQTGQRGIDKRRVKETKVNFSATLESLHTANLALVQRASVTPVAAGSAVDEQVTAYPGKTVALAHLKVSSVVVKSDDETPVTYEADKNYTVNDEAGSINILSAAEQTARGAAANIAEGDVLEVSYSYAAQTRVSAMTEASKSYWLRFEGLNTENDNKAVVVNVFKVSPSLLKELALINESMATLPLEGSAELDVTRTVGSKFYEEIFED